MHWLGAYAVVMHSFARDERMKKSAGRVANPCQPINWRGTSMMDCEMCMGKVEETAPYREIVSFAKDSKSSFVLDAFWAVP